MTEENYQPSQRRPIASRELPIMGRIAGSLHRLGISANTISVTSVVFASAAGVALAATAQTADWMSRGCWLAAALLVQLRLLANLFDGMVALASATASPVGELFNEVPDRLADSAVLIGLGLAAGGSPTLGYLAALIAIFVAYVRAMGSVAGASQVFIGPMAKPHRMFVVTLVCLYHALTPGTWQPVAAGSGLGLAAVALGVIAGGGLVTAVRRLGRIANELRGGRAAEEPRGEGSR